MEESFGHSASVNGRCIAERVDPGRRTLNFILQPAGMKSDDRPGPRRRDPERSAAGTKKLRKDKDNLAWIRGILIS